MNLESFHPAVATWFRDTFSAPTPAQRRAWPAIQSGRHALIAAPTGSGKTLAAFLAAVDDLVRRGVEAPLPDETAIVYVSPLKALSNDIRINLEVPIEGIRAELARRGLPDVEITSVVRTGDTPQAERASMRKRAPHIVVTTPESLYILLGSASGRAMLASTRTVIVDEIHALAGNKRGSHLALSLERLEALCERRLVRIGLSATQKPLDDIARFLVGAGSIDAVGGPAVATQGMDASELSPGMYRARRAGTFHDGLFPHSGACEIVDVGYTRERDLAIELPAAPLEAVMSADTWSQVYARIAELVAAHRTTLVFVNTRRMAERAARHLSELLDKSVVAAHHGSLAKEHRLDAEQRLKRGELRVLVATASLELGIDIGEVGLVCQLGSPRSIAAFLQRAGRSGHAVGATPKARLFPQSRDDLVECAALLDSVRRGELDRIDLVRDARDVLAQQIVAEVASREWSEDGLFDLVRRAWPFATLEREEFNAIVRMLAEGFTTRRGSRAAYLHRDAVHGQLRARRGARLTALTSGGTIPDTADYTVILEPQAINVGTVNEDFAVESIAGDIFQLGNASYRILRVERGRVRVEDAQGAPPTIPFWLGEAPGRTDELSASVSRLREEISSRLDAGDGMAAAETWLREEVGLDESAIRQLVDYLAAAKAALGVLPTRRELAMERFFDESGGTQLVIHTPFGSRINRAWGLALRKRFCRTFNFELQAAATEDAIVLSLSTSHSFPLEDVARYLHSNSVREVLVQALLDAPMFGVRWRWNATTSLALPRFVGGNRVAPQLQRMKSEDLLASVFPDQVACAENLVGERQIPDHPLVAQTLHDCLHEAMDIEGLERLLRALEAGEARIVARDLTEPSPLAAEVLGARPYAYLDDAPLEERRTQAVMSRRFDPQSASDLGRLSPDAIDAVRAEAWPEAGSVDEMHAVLLDIGFVTDDDVRRVSHWPGLLQRLARDGRATCFLSLLPLGEGGHRPDEGSAKSEALRVDRTLSRPFGAPSPDGRGESKKASGEVTVGTSACPIAIWVAAERLPQFDALFGAAQRDPPIVAPAEFAAVAWTPEDALVELVRARLTALGPVHAATIAASLALTTGDIEVALLRLETEGYVMRGHFTPGVAESEWCERHQLARIHRYTLQRLRREIEPVEARDFMRFLFEWQRVATDAQVAGPDALANIIAQLEGFEAPAGAWETEILPARVAGYEISWLDDLCLAGRVVWTRLRRRTAPAAQRERGGGPVRSSPIALLLRRHLAAWNTLRDGAPQQAPLLTSRAQAVADYLGAHGASFFDEIAAGTRLLQVELENALAELVAAGRVNSDSFAGLRALLVPSAKRNSRHARRVRRSALLGIADAGRWSLIRMPVASDAEAPSDRRGPTDPEALEHIARLLLRRYGVVFWRLLQREADWLPPWRELLRVYQRLEARGEIRGGRFVEGIVGAQFALPEAVGLLRRMRRRERSSDLVCISGADPLNLTGIVTAGDKVPTVTGARIVYRAGIPVATMIAGNVEFQRDLDEAERTRVRQALVGPRQAPEAGGESRQTAEHERPTG